MPTACSMAARTRHAKLLHRRLPPRGGGQYRSVVLLVLTAGLCVPAAFVGSPLGSIPVTHVMPVTSTSTAGQGGKGAQKSTTSRKPVASTRATTSTTVSTTTSASATTTTTTPAGGALSVHVAGNQLVNGAGQPVRLVGVDRSGTEYACAQGWGIFDGPSDQASVAAVASWGINAVRIPLNEDCWLGINGVDPQWSGQNYQQAIEQYVALLGAANIVTILDLHWSAPGDELAMGQQVMADADHSTSFWSSVASAFRSNPAVIFDLYNEPNNISWDCWLNGCTIPASGSTPAWQATGMQSLVDAVRQAGATQPVLIGGLDWAGDLSGWLANQPVDPLHQEVASVHVYNFSGCASVQCWDTNYAPVSAVVPVIAGEVGENSCTVTFPDTFFDWADANDVSYLAWTWDTWGCPEALINSYDGTPSASWGAAYQTHLASLPSRPVA